MSREIQSSALDQRVLRAWPIRCSVAGRISTTWLTFLGSGALLIILIILLAWNPQRSAAVKSPLVIYCAAGIKAPVEAVAREYEKLEGVSIQLQYGGSQTLLASIEV